MTRGGIADLSATLVEEGMLLNKITSLSAAVAGLLAAAPLVAATAATLHYLYSEPLTRPTRDYAPVDAVFLRAGPATGAPVLRPGMQLRVTAGANYGWTQVRSPQGAAWAYGS
jgi:hypothetical protein